MNDCAFEIELWRKQSTRRLIGVLLDGVDAIDLWSLLLQPALVGVAVPEANASYLLWSDTPAWMSSSAVRQAVLALALFSSLWAFVAPYVTVVFLRTNMADLNAVNRHKVFLFCMRGDQEVANQNFHTALLAGFGLILVDLPNLLLRIVVFWSVGIFPSAMLVKNFVFSCYRLSLVLSYWRWSAGIQEVVDTFDGHVREFEERLHDMATATAQFDDVYGPFDRPEQAFIDAYIEDILDTSWPARTRVAAGLPS
mmetsp:Transcript_76173/g.203605  ORF Transcript_76173/g.203605 Transcript_76173/m.203605 type:complete len:253 (+) Transcript_76173:151-909(+)